MGLVSGQQPFVAGSRQAPLIGLQVFFVTVALSIYLLRVYTRAYVLRSIGTDDCLMGIAVVSRHCPMHFMLSRHVRLTIKSWVSSSALDSPSTHALAPNSAGAFIFLKYHPSNLAASFSVSGSQNCSSLFRPLLRSSQFSSSISALPSPPLTEELSMEVSHS